MTKMFSHTVHIFDMESRYAAGFFLKEQCLLNFCGRVKLAIPEIKEIEMIRSNDGSHYFQYRQACDYYGKDDDDNAEIWHRLFLFYEDYTDDLDLFIATHGQNWREQKVFDPGDYHEYREQQNKRKFVNRLAR